MTKVQPETDLPTPRRPEKIGRFRRAAARIPLPVRIAAAVAVAGMIVFSPSSSRLALLRAAGWLLVANDPIRPVDAIVVAVDARDAGVIEAADLVRSGQSPRVAVFADLPDEFDLELMRRGIPYEDQAVRQTRLLRALGVKHVEVIPVPIAGTEDEGRVLPAWCDELRLRSVIIVASADHTRRLRRVFRRTMKGHALTVIVRGSTYSSFDPDRWWRKRSGIRTEIIELQKLLFDFVRYPIS
jgi:uncharacterized SAM-binding protein YcdF (DUF218 family)